MKTYCFILCQISYMWFGMRSAMHMHVNARAYMHIYAFAYLQRGLTPVLQLAYTHIDLVQESRAIVWV